VATKARTQPGNTKIEDFNPLENVQDRYEKNKKAVNIFVTVLLAAVVGFFVYLKLYKEPRETKAATAIAQAQTYFQKDSLDKALNGDGQGYGFLRIIKRYGGTKAANLSNYYAGLCYLKMNDPKNAIKYLKEFDAQGTLVAYTAYGALGDAYMENNQIKEGIEYYNKAAANKDNNLITPLYLQRAALAYEMNNQTDKAIENYKRIRDEYPQSMQARDIDKSLAKLGVLN